MSSQSDDLTKITKKIQDISYGPSSKGKTNFVDKTKDYGLENLHAMSMNAVDLDFDGHVDLSLLPTYYSRPRFYLFDKTQKKFIPWKHDPLPADFKASYLLFYDINKDRVPDLIAGVLNQRSEVSQIPLKLYVGSVKNGLLSFHEEQSAFKLPPEPTSGLSLIDYDLDGWIDLYVANWYETRNGQYITVASRLLRNNKGKFEEMTHLLRGEADKASDQLFPPGARPNYGASTCDIDQNGFPDILTTSSSGHKNKLWMNLKDTRSGERYFEDQGANSLYAADAKGSLIPTGGGRTFFSACTDYNDDGIMDVFLGELSHAYDNDSVDKSSVLTGSRETYPPFFLRTEYISDATSESWNQGDRRGIWMDYNSDGKVDLVVDNSGFPPYSRLVLFEQNSDHSFHNVASEAGIDVVNPTGTISLDLNGDGKLDLITSQNNIRQADISPRIYVFENHTQTPGRKIIRVNLDGIKSNTHGIGAMVMLYTLKGSKKIVQRRWVEYTQGGLPSQNAMGIHFGIDIGVDAVGVKVRWPYLKKSGFGSGEVLEKLYSLNSFPNKSFLEVTLCEDGRILPGKVPCQL